MKKAYWIANYTEIKDDERLKKYAVKAKEAVEKYSGKILARSANNITLDGREIDRKSTRLNSSHSQQSRMPSSA